MSAQSAKTASPAKLLPPPPPPDDPGSGGGGGGPLPPNGGLVSYTADLTQYGSLNPDGVIGLIEQNGPSYHTPYSALGTHSGQANNIDIYHLFPTWPNSALGGGGAFNDRARSALFYGKQAGLHYELYDSPDASKSDDWVEITVKKDIPAGLAYYVWTFESSFYDDYVSVTYHANNGLDGKVSFIKITPVAVN
ncbi:hypothetical protein ACEN9X_28225 [Mucilaginibacter sp. Mucisp86]|uniref:hypothetical protein n=1 Tax=Mucilaginibacter sp. Mucisp86 TaxID=3243060 RepID=UPI0039B4935C